MIDISSLFNSLETTFAVNAAKAYFYSSLPFMLSQCICAAISVSLLFVPICKVLSFALDKNK